MTPWTLALGLLAATAAAESGHDENDVYQALRREGWKVGSTAVPFPGPTLPDDATAEQERAALRTIAGPGRAVDDFTRDSVAAPFVMKTRDIPLEGGDLVRSADVWFVVRAGLDRIEPATFAADPGGKEVEAGNMKFGARRLDADEIASRGLPAGDLVWFVRSHGRLLDRIEVESTSRIRASRGARSWVFASRDESRLDDDPALPNRWRPIVRADGRERAGEPRPYAGGAGVVTLTELTTVPGALLVEARFAFVEPRPWFDGAPILRSKLNLIAQDRIRALRRELARGSSR